MTIEGVEVGFVSTDRRLVDWIAAVFQLEELRTIEVGAELMEQLPAARPATQYRLRARDGVILKVTVPQASPSPTNVTDHVLAGTGLRYVTMYVTDLDGVVERARQLGGTIEQEPTGVLGAPLALIHDPDGNLYELSQIPS